MKECRTIYHSLEFFGATLDACVFDRSCLNCLGSSANPAIYKTGRSCHTESVLSANMTKPYGTYHDPDIPNDVDGFGECPSPSLHWPFNLVSRSNLIKCQGNE